MSTIRPFIQQAAAFLGAGIIATLCHYIVLITLVETDTLSVVRASAAGAFVGAIAGYWLNYRFAFRSSAPHSETVPRYLIIAAAALGMNTLLMYGLHDLIGLRYLNAQLVTTGFVFGITFLGNRMWTFDRERMHHSVR